MLTELTKESVRVRHWKQVMEVTGATFNIAGSDMKLSELLDANLENYKGGFGFGFGLESTPTWRL